MSETPLIEFDRVGKQHVNDGVPATVLDRVSLRIDRGEFVAIVGPSGCGKSTLLRIALGLDREHAGRVTHRGVPVAGVGPERGMVFQEHRLFPWLTVEQNVAVALEGSTLAEPERRRAVADQLATVGLSPVAKAFPQQLSGGMAQRVAIARALVGRPEVLLLDEPFGALDAMMRAKLQVELLRLWKAHGMTAILVTHDVEEAVFLADRIVVMQAGPGRIDRIVEVDLPRPRDRAGTAFAAVRREVMRAFHEDPAHA